MNIARRYANFSVFILVMVVTTLALLGTLHPARALLAGFDAGALLFLGLTVRKFGRDKAVAMRAHAADNEPDHHVLTVIALLVVGVVLTAVWTELTGSGGRHATGIALAAVTLAFAWLYANSLFTLHYAHVYYLPGEDGDRDDQGDRGDCGGLDFPGDEATPDYWDFAYFAFVIGMTFQVSDVAITSRRIRRLALLHGMLAFLFNIGVVALSVSLVASVLGG